MTKPGTPAKDFCMGRLRALLKDRVSGGIAAALTGYLLVLQIFVAAFTCGLTVPVEAGAQFVLCQPAQFSADRSVSDVDGDDHGYVHICPCVICNSNDLDAVVLMPESGELGPVYTAYEYVERVVTDDAVSRIDPSKLGLASAPRGPPSSYV
jgi:hypothetical protein